jgi:uncharacterized protein YjbI with pentapeptide repeats
VSNPSKPFSPGTVPGRQPQRLKRYLWPAAGMAVFLIVLGVALALGYTAAWTGFNDFVTPGGEFQRGKTLWDWLELLIVPVVLAGGAFWLNTRQSRIEHELADRREAADAELALDRQRETALQTYLDRMTELLLEKNLRESAATDEVRSVARTRTLTVLQGLDGRRKGTVLLFLQESSLIVAGEAIVDLRGADLRGAVLHRANLRRAGLTRANLAGADLSEAYIEEALLSSADLEQTDLHGAHLAGANLHKADLRGANLQRADLRETFLSAADLSHADLRWSYLTATNLVAANLSNADLREVYVSGAYLSNADLRGAKLDGTDLSGVDLSEVMLPDGTRSG